MLNKKSYAERERSKRLYEEREKETPTVIDPNRPKTIKIPMKEQAFFAARYGDVEEFEELVSKGVDINSQNSDGITLLHLSILEDEIDVFKMLLDKGADPNLADRDWWTPLHLSVFKGNDEATSLLLKSGNINSTPIDFEGKTPLNLVETSKSPESEKVKKMLKDFAKTHKTTEQDIAHQKVAKENKMLEDIKKAHEEGFSLEEPSDEGCTMLHIAVCYGYESCVMYLLDKCKVKVNAKDHEQWTPLHCASYWGRDGLIPVLLEHGASLTLTTITGETPLDFATGNTQKVIEVGSISSKKVSTWARLKWAVMFTMSLEKGRPHNTVKRHSLDQRTGFTRRDTQKEAEKLKGTRLFGSSSEDEPVIQSDGKKRRKRRSTGASNGPRIDASGITDTSICFNIGEYDAEWYVITYEVEEKPESKTIFNEKFQGREFKIEGLSKNTKYCVEVTPGLGEHAQPALQSVVFITTSE